MVGGITRCARLGRVAAMVAGAALVTACGTPSSSDAGDASRSPDVSDMFVQWTCPATWVRYALGGCGPQVLLCAPDGGAAPGACDGVDITQRPDIALEDGGVASGLYRLPDGGIGGGWPEPGDSTQPPGESWAPDAGIPACPSTWHRLADGTCDPMLRTDCPVGSEALPGSTCTATGTADCPAGAYADVAAEATGATLVHVRAGADPMGADGTVARPFATVAAGLASAGVGGWVLVAAGSYPEAIAISAAAHLVGRCSADVTLVAPARTIAVDLSGAALDLRGVTLGGGGVRAANRAQLRLRGVRISGAVSYGLSAFGTGTQIDAADVVVTRTHAPPGPAATTYGVFARDGARVTLGRLVVVDNNGGGIAAADRGTAVVVTDAVVRGTHPGPDGRFGRGLDAESGGILTATRVVVADNTEMGAAAFGAGARLELIDAVVRATSPTAAGTFGYGLDAESGATLIATRVLVADNAENGVVALDARTRIEMIDAVVRATRPSRDGTLGRGLDAEAGAILTATRVLVADNAELGAHAGGVGTRLELVETIVRATRPSGDGTGGNGLNAQTGAMLTATRVLVADNTLCGASAIDPGTRLDLVDTVVRTTRPSGDGTGGRGLSAVDGAMLTATRVLVTDNTELGAAVFGGGTRLDLVDTAVRATHPIAGGAGGYGLYAAAGSTLAATRVIVSNNSEFAVVAVDPDTMLALQDVLVTDVAPTFRGLGIGIDVVGGAASTFERLAVDGAAGAGLAAGVSPREGLTEPARVSGVDLFVRDVAASTVLVRNSLIGGADREVGYGLHAATGCVLEVRGAVIDAAQYGAYSAGTITLRDGVIARMSVAALARNSAALASGLSVTNVRLRSNQSDATVVDNSLPEAAIETANAACAMPPCL